MSADSIVGTCYVLYGIHIYAVTDCCYQDYRERGRKRRNRLIICHTLCCSTKFRFSFWVWLVLVTVQLLQDEGVVLEHLPGEPQEVAPHPCQDEEAYLLEEETPSSLAASDPSSL